MTPERIVRKRESMRIYWERVHARGDCMTSTCRNQPEINPTTGAPYWKCRACRIVEAQRRTDHRERV